MCESEGFSRKFYFSCSALEPAESTLRSCAQVVGRAGLGRMSHKRMGKISVIFFRSSEINSRVPLDFICFLSILSLVQIEKGKESKRKVKSHSIPTVTISWLQNISYFNIFVHVCQSKLFTRRHQLTNNIFPCSRSEKWISSIFVKVCYHKPVKEDMKMERKFS